MSNVAPGVRTHQPDAAVKTVFLVATEVSGDLLGSALMRELRARLGEGVRFKGVGGVTMAAEGLVSLFPIEQLSIIGLAGIARKLPLILRLMRQTAEAAVASSADIVVLIDSPDFNLRVAKRIRRSDPKIPIVDYVAPTVWAWRPGRAKAMRGSVDHVMALLPFEPEAFRKLQGPPCSYVGHPLLEQMATLRPDAAEADRRREAPPVLLALPGSRRSEIGHHMPIFGEALRLLREQGQDFELVVPTMPHVAERVREAAKSWPVQPRIVMGDDDRKAAFRVAHAALAKSGTVTLELALSGVPMVTAYKIGEAEAWLFRKLIKVDTAILANLVAGENVVPEFIQENCTAKNLAGALQQVLSDTPLRQRQVEAFSRLGDIMATGGRTPSACAADIVMAHIR